MPNIFNQSNSSKDILERNKNLAALGNSLEARVRKDIYPNFSFATIVSAGTFETTQKTIGTPVGSVVKIATFPTSAATINIASTSANDTLAGTGARALLITGLDADWELLTETVLMSGQTPVTTSSSFLRINNMLVVSVGSLGFNEGDIYVSTNSETFISGIPQNILYYAIIAKQNVASFGHYSVQAHHKLHFLKGNIYTSAVESEPILVQESLFSGGIEYQLGPAWYSTNISINFDGSNSYTEKVDIKILGNTATGLREGSIAYETALEDILIDRTIN